MIRLDNESLSTENITKGIMFFYHVLCCQVVYLRYTATGGKIISDKGVGKLSIRYSEFETMHQTV